MVNVSFYNNVWPEIAIIQHDVIKSAIKDAIKMNLGNRNCKTSRENEHKYLFYYWSEAYCVDLNENALSLSLNVLHEEVSMRFMFYSSWYSCFDSIVSCKPHANISNYWLFPFEYSLQRLSIEFKWTTQSKSINFKTQPIPGNLIAVCFKWIQVLFIRQNECLIQFFVCTQSYQSLKRDMYKYKRRAQPNDC